MTHKESVKWLDNLINAIGKSQYQELWGYAQALTEIKEILEKENASAPMCKIGDTVYQTDSERIYESKIKRIIYDTENIAFDEEAIGQSVFLSKSEAEEKLNNLAKSRTCGNECIGCCHYTECGYFDDSIRLGEEKAFAENCVGCCCGDGTSCNKNNGGCANYETKPIMG